MKNFTKNFKTCTGSVHNLTRATLITVIILSLHLYAVAYIPVIVTPEALRKTGTKKGDIPLVIYKLFPAEYAIVVRQIINDSLGYCLAYDKTASDSFYDSINKKSLTSGLVVSESARNAWIKELDPNRESKSRFIFDWDVINCAIIDSMKVADYIEAYSAVIDLKNIASDFSFKDVDYHGMNKRALNLARVMEHELLGHVINNLLDNKYYWSDAYNPGEAAAYANTFTKEMGLPLRWNYSIHDVFADKATIIFISDKKEVFLVVFHNLSQKHEIKLHKKTSIAKKKKNT